MRSSIVRQLALSFTLSVILLLIPAAVCYYSLLQLFDSSKWVTHTQQVIDRLETLVSEVENAQTSVRGYLLTGEAPMLKPYIHASSASQRTYSDIGFLTRDNLQQQNTLPLLRTHMRKTLQVLDSLKILKDGHRDGYTTLIHTGEVEMTHVREIVALMQQRERGLLAVRSQKEERYMVFSSILILAISLMAPVIVYLFFKRLKWSIWRSLALQEELKQKDISISQRLSAVESYANKITAGDYQIRVTDAERDLLGSLANAINQMAASLAYAFGALEQQMKRKDEFISIASHELKTPLTSIKATMQVLVKHEFDNEKDRKIHPFIVRANKQVKRLSEIVDNLLDVGRLSQEKVQLNTTHFLLYEAIIDCTTEIFSVIKTHQLEITGEQDIEVFADKFRIEQVVVNMVSNAIKYSPQANKVLIDIHQEDGQVKVSVRDFGIGIPTEHIPYLFGRYYRAHETSQAFSGIGLGLYISYELIKRHSGYMGVTSEQGHGSTFWFTLPIF